MGHKNSYKASEAYIAAYEKEHQPFHPEVRDSVVVLLSHHFEEYGEPDTWPDGDVEQLFATAYQYDPNDIAVQQDKLAEKHQKPIQQIFIIWFGGLLLLFLGLDADDGLLINIGAWMMCITGLLMSCCVTWMLPTAKNIYRVMFIATLGLLGSYIVLYTSVDGRLILLGVPGFIWATIASLQTARRTYLTDTQSDRQGGGKFDQETKGQIALTFGCVVIVAWLIIASLPHF